MGDLLKFRPPTPLAIFTMAGRAGAVLRYTEIASGAELGFEMPREHQATLDFIFAVLESADSWWKKEYVARAMNFVDAPTRGELAPGTVLRFDLGRWHARGMRP